MELSRKEYRAHSERILQTYMQQFQLQQQRHNTLTTKPPPSIKIPKFKGEHNPNVYLK